jgi:hypothetical protein
MKYLRALKQLHAAELISIAAVLLILFVVD